jgi:predicted lipoprotein with Yx(FWY)xxD motif
LNRLLRVVVIPATAALLVLATGCSKQDSTPPPPPVGANDAAAGTVPNLPPPLLPAGAPSSSPASEGAALGGPAEALAVREDPALGPVVTNAGGFTLYRFDKDDPKAPKSNCDGACAQTWPPVAAGSTAANGIESKALGEVVRTDGSKQLTIGGWPVYRYSQDTSPGETKGQTVANWGAIAPDGKRAARSTQRDSGKERTEPNRDSRDERGREDRGRENNQESEITVNIINQTVLGGILVDSRGRTLYNNGGGFGQSTCVGSCRSRWQPALIRGGNIRVNGIDSRLVSSRRLPDETVQLVINGEPVFVFDGDSVRGDITGHGMSNRWSAINSNGQRVRK